MGGFTLVVVGYGFAFVAMVTVAGVVLAGICSVIAQRFLRRAPEDLDPDPDGDPGLTVFDADDADDSPEADAEDDQYDDVQAADIGADTAETEHADGTKNNDNDKSDDEQGDVEGAGKAPEPTDVPVADTPPTDGPTAGTLDEPADRTDDEPVPAVITTGTSGTR